MRNTGDLRLVSGLNCGGCILLSFAEWEEVKRSHLTSQESSARLALLKLPTTQAQRCHTK